jgi:glycosyltransferase involved in cell wall biosynthesis
MDTAPLVSVIVTAFNQEAFLGEAIESIIKQGLTHWECIIIDDGSTDNTAQVCRDYEQRDARIKYVYQPNHGVAAARNHGFRLSRGKYIQFLDGDDFLMPEKLDKQLAYMEAHPETGVSYTNHFHFWNDTKQYASYDFEVLDTYPLKQFLYGHDNGVSLPVHAALIRREIWSEGELPFVEDYPYRYEDWIFWVRICLRQVRFHFIDERLVAYRMHGRNFVTDHPTVAFNALQAVMYISNLLPAEERNTFAEKKVRFIVDRLYHAAAAPAESKQHLAEKAMSRVRALFRRI